MEAAFWADAPEGTKILTSGRKTSLVDGDDGDGDDGDGDDGDGDDRETEMAMTLRQRWWRWR